MSDLDVSPDMDPQAVLAHYGVKGMQWGKRKSPDEGGEGGTSAPRQGMTDGQKKALKYAAGGALLAGALITTAVLAKNGKLPMGVLNPNSLAAETRRMAKVPGTIANKNKMDKAAAVKDKLETAKKIADTAKRGKEVMDQLQEAGILQKKMQDFQNEIDEAHRQQNRDMIDDSAKAGIGYDPARDNEFSPEARANRR